MTLPILGAFKEKAFLFLWLGEIFTQISINLFQFYLIIVVFLLTKSNTAVSAAVISFTLPAILFGVLAGVYVDHWNKKKVLILTNVVRAFLLLILAFFSESLFALYAISFFVSILTQFFIPAESPMIPLTVPTKKLFSANALFGIGIYGSILIAYMLSTPLLLNAGHMNTLFVLAILFLIGAVFIQLIRLSEKKLITDPSSVEPKLEVKKELRLALSIMLKTKEIYSSLFLLTLVQIFILIIAAIAPGYASQVLHMNVEEFPLLFVVPGAIGMLLGAVIIVHYFDEFPRERLVTVGLFVSGIAMLILPFAANIASKEVVLTLNTYLPRLIDITSSHILVVLASLIGLANALIFVPSHTILQEKTSEELRGKMYGVLNALVGIFSLLPILLVGSLSDLIGVGNVIFGLGVALIILGMMKISFS